MDVGEVIGGGGGGKEGGEEGGKEGGRKGGEEGGKEGGDEGDGALEEDVQIAPSAAHLCDLFQGNGFGGGQERKRERLSLASLSLLNRLPLLPPPHPDRYLDVEALQMQDDIHRLRGVFLVERRVGVLLFCFR